MKPDVWWTGEYAEAAHGNDEIVDDAIGHDAEFLIYRTSNPEVTTSHSETESKILEFQEADFRLMSFCAKASRRNIE